MLLAPLTAPQIEKAVVQKDNSVKLTWNSITTGSTEESLIGYKVGTGKIIYAVLHHKIAIRP